MADYITVPPDTDNNVHVYKQCAKNINFSALSFGQTVTGICLPNSHFQ